MKIEISVVIAAMINFLLFFIIFRAFFYKPVNKMISTREDEIKDRLQNTEDNQKRAEELRIENEEHIKNSKEEGKVIVQQFKDKAEKMSNDILKESRDGAQLLLDRAKLEISREKDKAKDELRKEAVDIAVAMSVKALQGTIDEASHRTLIEDFIAKVGV